MAAIPPEEHDRTVAHMNNDHASDLSLYLRHFNSLPAEAASDPQLLALDLTSMTIRSSSGVHRVAIRPPMKRWADRRTALTEMALSARAAALPAHQPALDDGGDVSGSFRVPALLPDLATGAAVAWYFSLVAAVRAGLLRGGDGSGGSGGGAGLLGRAVAASGFPGGGAGLERVVMLIFPFVLAIHIAEAGWMAAGRLRRHGVPVGSRVWLLWVGCTFFEGVCAFWRFDRMVKAKRRQLVEEKHKEGKEH